MTVRRLEKAKQEKDQEGVFHLFVFPEWNGAGQDGISSPGIPGYFCPDRYAVRISVIFFPHNRV